MKEKISWQQVVYGGQSRSKLDRYRKPEPVKCYYCGDPVTRLTGSFVNVCESCLNLRTVAADSAQKAITSRKTVSDTQEPNVIAFNSVGAQSAQRCKQCLKTFSGRSNQNFCSTECRNR